MVHAVATSAYKALVNLYPPTFRRQFASEMVCDFEEATCEAWREGRRLAVVRLWMQIGADLAWTLAAQWLRHGLPVVTILSALGTSMFVFAVTSLLRHTPRAIAPGPAEDLKVLILLTAIVVVLSAAVIVFTVCFWLMVLKRNARVRRV
jgi:hypothetical protein